MLNAKEQKFIIGLFVLIIFSISITQGIIEIRRSETPHIVTLFTNQPSEANLRSFEDKLIEVSFIENYIRPPMLYLYYQLGYAGSKAVKGLNSWLFYRPALDYVTGPYYDDSRIIATVNAEPKQDWNVVEAVVDLRDQLAKKNIDLIILPVPSKIEIFPDKATTRHLEQDNSAYTHTARFISELQRHQVEVINLFPYFMNDRYENDKTAKEELFLAHDTHWSGRGIELVAKIIADRIKQCKWYTESKDRIQYLLKDTLVQRYGDLVTMMNIFNYEELFGLEPVHCTQVISRNMNELYNDSKNSPILYLGDSFSRIYQTDEPTSAGLISRLAYELQMPLTTIVNDGGASTLVRQQLARKSKLLDDKKLVIWEFVDRDLRFGMKGWKKIKIIEK